ncbi:MAG: enoyl-[acyl-carrier-protein] reductase FabK [Anaerovoracaceae bacterium]
MNRVCEVLGTEYPIIQGAMARIAESSLASAVSNGGGLGIIASGGYDAEWLRAEIRKVKAMTDKPFGVNLMLMMPNIDELIQVVCEEKVPVVTTGAGNPGKYMKTLKDAGVKVIPVVASVALAVRVERAGADAVIAEGTEAGGHIGETTTMALVPQVADAVDIPVIAAGGIADGRGIAAAFMLGAEGVQLGTRFVVAKECTVSQNYKDAIIKAKDTDTCATGRITGHPVRVIKNKLAKEMLSIEKNATAEEAQAVIDKLGLGSLGAAVFDGDMDRGSIMSGQIAGIVKKEQPAAEMIAEMFKEAEEIYNNRKDLF